MVLPYQLHQRLNNNNKHNNSQQTTQSNEEEEELRLLVDCSKKSFLEFNNIIGLPQKNDRDYPIFDYEKELVNDILNNQHVWVLKAAGLGITEIVLRYLAWVCLFDNRLQGKQIHIISGTGMNFANDLKVRLERLFERKYPDLFLQSKFTELILNKCRIRIFPTKQIKDLRGHVDVSYIFIDEGDYYDPAEQQELPYVIKRYEEKCKAKIIMVSTPNRPDGLFHAIESGQVFQDFFHKIKLGYELGLNKIYDTAFIEREKSKPEFEREYNLKYLGKIGNVFSPMSIDKVIQLGELYKNIPVNDYCVHSIGVDPGFGSSRTAIVQTEFLKEERKIRVLYAEEFDNANPQDIVNLLFDMYVKHWNTWIWVDGSNRAFVNLLKVAFNESLGWESNSSKSISPESHKVIPVNFSTDHKSMLAHLAMLINKEYLAIPKEYDKLIVSLRTAYAREYSLDKEQTSYDDSLDALRLACKMYTMN